MTLQTDDDTRTYANPSGTTFNGPPAFVASTLFLYVVEADGVTRTLIPASDYTVSQLGRNLGTRIVLDSPIVSPTGKTLLIQRTVPYNQLTDITNQGDFNAQVLEGGLDTLGMQTQQLARQTARALRFPDNVLVDFDPVIPTPLNPLDIIQVRPDGLGLVMSPAPEIATVADGAIVDEKVSPLAGIKGDKLNFLQRGPNSIDRDLQDKARERVSVLDKIPPEMHSSIRDNTNVIDLLPYLNAARDDCALLPRAKLVFPPGFYRISGPFVVVQQGLCLDFEGGAQLVTTSATAHALQIGDGVTNPAQIVVNGLYVTSTVVKTNGAAVYLYGGNDITVQNLIIDGASGKLHDGVVFRGAPGQFGHYLDRFQISGCNAESVRLENGGVGVDLVSDVFLSRGVIHGGNAVGTTGILFLAGSGTYLHKIDVIGCDYGIRTNPATGNQVLYTFGTQVLADTCLSNGISLDDSGGKVLVFQMSTGWSNSSNKGLFSGGTAPQNIRNVKFTNFEFSNNKDNGIELFRTDNHQIIGCQISGNNTLNAPNSDGIKVRSGCSNFIIDACIIDNFYFITPAGNQKYGIEVEGGASDNYVITNNILRNNVTAGMIDGGAGTNKKVTANSGYTPPAIPVSSFSGAWVNTGGALEVAGYWKDADGTVHLRGSVSSGAVPSVIFTLPVGFRPAAQCKYAVDANGAHGRCDVKPGGTVEATTGSATAFSLDGISFKSA